MPEENSVIHYDGDFEKHDWYDLIDAGYTRPGWYFWDETGAYCHGPYPTKEAAYAALERYAEELG